jgi:hypothetical protein
MQQVVADCTDLYSVVENSVVVTPATVSRAKLFVERYSDMLKYEGFVFSIHAWEDPDRGRASIGRTNRSEQNIAALQVAAGFLCSKAQRFLASTTAAVTTVPVTSSADDVAGGLQVNNIVSCFASTNETCRDIEFMYGIAGGRLENWRPTSELEWSTCIQLALDIDPSSSSNSVTHRLTDKLSRIQYIIDVCKCNAHLMDDLYVLRTLVIMCLANDCQLIVCLDNGVDVVIV